MKMKVKLVVAALSAAGVIAPMTTLADTISPPTLVPPTAQSPAIGNTYSVSYPVTVTLAGGTPQALTFTYNSDGTWSAPSGWTYDASLNPNANTAVFTTTSGGVPYGIAISSTGTNQFMPGIGTPATTNPPSVGLNVANAPVTGTSIGGWSGATASGAIAGVGITTAPLNGAGAVVQIIGVGSGGAPVGTATIGSPTTTPSTATSGPGSAGGTITVNSNQPNQSIGWGQYTVTIPTTSTPSGTGSVSGMVAGTSGSVGAGGIYVNNISGTASYNTTTGVVTASPTETAVFGVDTSGNTSIGGNLSVAGQTTTHGLTNTGNVSTDTLNVTGNAIVGGTLGVTGQTTTHGIANTGALTTSTLAVSGATTTNGITNTGTLTNNGNAAISGNATVGGTLGVTGNVTLSGTLTSNGISNTGNIGTGTLGVTGNTTIGGTLAVAGQTSTHGITNTGSLSNSGNASVGGTLDVAGATTLGSTSGTGGNTATVSSAGIVLSTPGVGANSVVVNSSGSTITGGGASLRMGDGMATYYGADGGPVKVTGVADGSGQYDAVNYGQVEDVKKQLKRGISGASALANIPQVDQNKAFSLGIGVGGFDGETAFAIGGSARVAKDGILKASVGFAGGGSSSTTWGVGGAWSF